MAASVLTAPMASIGIPKEIKVDEQRVALTPDAVRELVSQGLEVRIESGAGDGAGIKDDAFARAGAQVVSREEAWGAHLVVKVKEPQQEEFHHLRQGYVTDSAALGLCRGQESALSLRITGLPPEG